MYRNESNHIDSPLGDLLSMTQIGAWDWNTKTGNIIYSTAWAEILGYCVEDLPQVVETWQSMVLPEDLAYVDEQINKHLLGESALYKAEFRMVRKDGSIIWVQDKGKITEYDEDGKALRFLGVLQDISRIKNAEEMLRKNQETLNIAVTVGGLGTCDWDMTKNRIQYNDEFLRMLGYSKHEITGVVEEWASMIHQEDLERSMSILNKYLSGELQRYECEIRMKHKDGRLIWTRNIAQIAERDKDGKPIRLIGAHLNIDALKRSEERLQETLKELEYNKKYLESEIENRTKVLTEQDKMLWTVNEISQNLFSVNHLEDIDEVIQSALEKYCNASGKERIALWKNKTIDGEAHCKLLYEYTSLKEVMSFSVDFNKLVDKDGIEKIAKDLNVNVTNDEILSLFSSSSREYVPYAKYLPSIHNHFMDGKKLNTLSANLDGFERIQMALRGVKAFLVSPIILNNEIWGFIGIDNCKDEELFTEVEEKMLSIVGFFLANSIQKNEGEKQTREAEERIQLMLDATPLCCNLWTTDFRNMTCNEEAVRLFELSSQQEYLDRFFELSPEYQPCGRLTSEMAIENITKAFEEGFCKFEWVHQKLDGTPIPSEITLVRIRYKDDFIVAGYTRDLREFKAMLAKLQAKEDALRAAMDEALLSSKAKTNFLANMSHEIRTPMNAISGFAEIILRESKDKQSSEYAIGIKNACNSLLNIINDILDISKIESGKLEIVNSQYELSSLLNDVIEISRMRLGKKPLLFVTNIDSKLPARLIGDEIRIKQILINLLSNAIKFTENGYISFRVYGEMVGTKTKLCFEVEDTGFGIKEEDLERLFAEFERINTTKNRSIEGTGLGLAISKQLCEMMDGEISVQSTINKGSLFTVNIFQECPEYEVLSTVPKAKSVLVYESRAVFIESITVTIENLGCKCIPCMNQSELSDNINLMPYDYILTSSMHLTKVKKLIKKHELNVALAVFADYGETIEDDTVHSISIPVNCLQIANLLNGQKEEDEFGIYDRHDYNFIAPKAHVLVVDDNPVNLKVATGLLYPYQFTVDTAENGLIAIEKVKNKKYDLVFMDHMMPEMDGIDATIAIRKLKDDYYQKMPIIALTANALVGTREMFIREGMNDFLAKPIEIGKLAHVLAKWIPNDKKISGLKREQVENEIDTLEYVISGVDTEKGIASVGGRKEDYLNILSSYYTDGMIKRSSLEQSFQKKDLLSFRTEVHSLKSTSATIGAQELSNIAAKLEMASINLDFSFIEGYLTTFLSMLDDILDEIAPLIHNTLPDQKSVKKLAIGNVELLNNNLKELYLAAEFANIGKIEEILNELSEFSWSEEIAQELSNIKYHLTMFDYDSIMEGVIVLQEINKY
ncbi:MAG: PAS domain-containing protein [Lachnospiraceae bacterium]